MSDLANLVLAGVRDKVVEDLKKENDQLSSKNTALSKTLLVDAPSFVRVENSSGTVLARTQQFPDENARCDCCSWFTLSTLGEAMKVKDFHEIEVCFGGSLETPFVKSNGVQLQQVTGYCDQSNRAAIQFTDMPVGYTVHVTVGPIPKAVGKVVFAKVPKNLRKFCEAVTAVAPEATVEMICLSIMKEKAVSLLRHKAKLSNEEIKRFLRLPDGKTEEYEESELDEAKDS